MNGLWQLGAQYPAWPQMQAQQFGPVFGGYNPQVQAPPMGGSYFAPQMGGNSLAQQVQAPQMAGPSQPQHFQAPGFGGVAQPSRLGDYFKPRNRLGLMDERFRTPGQFDR